MTKAPVRLPSPPRVASKTKRSSKPPLCPQSSRPAYTTCSILLIDPASGGDFVSQPSKRAACVVVKFTKGKSTQSIVESIRASQVQHSSHLSGLCRPGGSAFSSNTAIAAYAVAQNELLLGVPLGWTAAAASFWSKSMIQSQRLKSLMAEVQVKPAPEEEASNASSVFNFDEMKESLEEEGPSSGGGASVSKKEGEWRCDTCSSANPKDSNECLCCETAKNPPSPPPPSPQKEIVLPEGLYL